MPRLATGPSHRRWSKCHDHRRGKQMIVRCHARSERFHKGNHRTDLPRIVEPLKGIRKVNLCLSGKPPGEIDSRLVFAFMDWQAPSTFLIVEVVTQLQGIGQIPRASDKEIDRIRTHTMPQWKAKLSHAVCIEPVIVPIPSHACFSPA